LKGSLPIFIDTIGNVHSLGEAELLGFNEKKRATKALFCMNQPEIKSVDIADGLKFNWLSFIFTFVHFSVSFPHFLFHFSILLHFPIL
jgi:hypothetical protein